jgi:hypothetical protein
MSTPPAAGTKPVWKTDEQGRTTFRLTGPLVLWWAWVVFAVVNLLDLVIQSRDWFSLEITGALLVVTGFMYACALRPRVVTDATGVTVRNPFRDYRVPWPCMDGVFLGDSVEIQYRPPDAPPDSEPKTVYAWALYSPRRARARSELRMASGLRRSQFNQRQQRRYQVDPSASYGKAPAQAQAMARQHPSHVMAGELGRRCTAAASAGTVSAGTVSAGTASAGTVTGRWAWLAMAAVVLPAAFLAVVILAR